MKKNLLMGLSLAGVMGLTACAHQIAAPETTPFVTRQPTPLPHTPGDHPGLAGSQPNTTATAEPCLLAQAAGRRFLPLTPEPSFERILPAQENECGFYNWAQQAFLFTTQPDLQKRPAFVNYPDFARTFGLNAQPEDSHRLSLNAGINQAGEQAAILVDQNHNPVFYSIHLNPAFADFVKQQGLNQIEKLLKAPQQGGLAAELEFPPGAIELKAAWRVLEAGEDPNSYFHLPARVPVLRNQAGKVVPTEQWREVEVVLLSLHVVGVVQDHPEFIWATFEHVDAQGRPDLGPAAQANPTPQQPQRLALKHTHYPLFASNGLANFYRAQLLDESRQKFAQPTPVFRVFPASLSEQSEEDEELQTLNQDISRLFAETDPQQQDPRRFYRMVGAVWLDNPGADKPEGVFKADRSFDNLPDQTLLAGEDRLSNLALESFTQQTQPHCLSCHNTLAKHIGNQQFLPPRRINVSNTLTFFAQRALHEQHLSHPTSQRSP